MDIFLILIWFMVGAAPFALIVMALLHKPHQESRIEAREKRLFYSRLINSHPLFEKQSLPLNKLPAEQPLLQEVTTELHRLKRRAVFWEVTLAAMLCTAPICLFILTYSYLPRITGNFFGWSGIQSHPSVFAQTAMNISNITTSGAITALLFSLFWGTSKNLHIYVRRHIFPTWYIRVDDDAQCYGSSAFSDRSWIELKFATEKILIDIRKRKLTRDKTDAVVSSRTG